MTRRNMGALLLTAVLLTAVPMTGNAAAYSFPYAGVRLAADDGFGWTVLAPETLSDAESIAFLEPMGVDAKMLAADYATEGTLFEVYMPDGEQVRLNVARTAETEGWQDITLMSEADKNTLMESFSRAPYEHTEWVDTMPGYLQYDWTVMAGDTPVSFAGLLTVRDGALYMLVASGTAEVPALHTAAQTVAESLTFLDATVADAVDEGGEGIVIPSPIEDDGKVTPIALENFDGITYDDTTKIAIRTLPDTDLVLRTATDALRGRSDGDGKHSFSVSTRRESLYTYTITAEAEGRSASEISLSVERQLTQDEQDAVYRRTAQQIYSYGYNNLIGAPEAYVGNAVTFRGKVGGFTDLAGFPCVLVYTENPGTGVWRMPMWVMLTEATTLAEDDMVTVYGDLRGDVLAYEDAEGGGEAPVVIGRSVQP